MLALPRTTTRHVEVTPTCWLWRGGRTRDGYGKAGDGVAHRSIWKRLGLPLTDVEDLHHLCGVKLCVRPEHLEPMHHADHTRLHKEQQVCSEGHPYIHRNGRNVCLACDSRRQRAYRARRRSA